VGTAPWRRARIRRGAALVEPLVGSSLERGVDIAEAMAARGYGGATMTRLPQAALRGPERIATTLAIALGLIALGVIVGTASYRTYPVAETVLEPAAVLTALATLVIGAAIALLLRPGRAP
jgi:hypothetical protein